MLSGSRTAVYQVEIQRCFLCFPLNSKHNCSHFITVQYGNTAQQRMLKHVVGVCESSGGLLNVSRWDPRVASLRGSFLTMVLLYLSMFTLLHVNESLNYHDASPGFRIVPHSSGLLTETLFVSYWLMAALMARQMSSSHTVGSWHCGY